MFSNLTQGSILYGVDTTNEYTLFTAPITKTVLPHAKLVNNATFMQAPEMVVDIFANVNGEIKEFKQIPANNSIADFGENSVILADSRESLNAYINAMRNTSINVINSIDKHKEHVKQYDSVLTQLNPTVYTKSDENVQELKDEVTSLKTQLAEAIALLKGETSKT